MTTTTYTLNENLNKAEFVFEIHNFQQARRKKSNQDYIESDEILIGGTAFSLKVYPKGGTEKGNMSVFLTSDHDIVVDFSIKATPGCAVMSDHLQRIEKGYAFGMRNFMRGDKIEGALKFEVEVAVKSRGETTDSGLAGVEGIAPNISDMTLNEVGTKSEAMMNQADTRLEGSLNQPARIGRKPQTELELEALSSQLMGMEAELHHLLNSDRSLIESKAKEMSEVLSELEEAEEEKAAIQKQIADVDATIGELQDRKGILVTGIRDRDQKLENLQNKKRELENLIEEKVRESKDARDQLERDIERVKSKLEGLSKVETEQPASLGEGDNLRLKWLESLESKIETEEKELECPVCLEVASFPIYSVHL